MNFFTTEHQFLVPQLDAVCFGSLAQRNGHSRQSIAKLLSLTSDDCLRMFDVNIRKQYYTKEIITASLKAANGLKVNDEELSVLRGMYDLKGTEIEQLQAMIDQYDLKLGVLTCAERGAYISTGSDVSFLKPPAIRELVSTIGAGDAFTAMVMIGYLNNYSLAEMNEKACHLAGYVCTQQGAVPV